MQNYTTTQDLNLDQLQGSNRSLWQTIIPAGTIGELNYRTKCLLFTGNYTMLNTKTGERKEKFGKICTGQFGSSPSGHLFTER